MAQHAGTRRADDIRHLRVGVHHGDMQLLEVLDRGADGIAANGWGGQRVHDESR